jgi:sarcosine oxidase subunit beta
MRSKPIPALPNGVNVVDAREADVVVVGGGIVGVASAYYLARAGKRVALFDKGAIAGEASGRNGGHLSPTIDGAWAPLAKLALDIWPKLVEEIDGPTEFCRAGGLYIVVADDPTEPADLLAYRHERGFIAELVPPDECRKLLPGLSNEIKGGVLSPRHGHVNPILTTKSLARAGAHIGVSLRLHTEVRGISVRGGVVEGVETDDGAVAAPIVVDAAGPWAARIAAMAGVVCPVSPRRIQILLSEGMPRLTDLVWGGNGLYARQARSGQLHFGSAGPPWESPVLDINRDVSPTTMQRTAKLMLELMPGIADLRILRTWAGTIGPTPDGMPILEACDGHDGPRGFIIATGFGGNGFVTGPAVGKVVAELVTRGESHVPIDGLSLDRFARSTPA